MLRKNHVTLAHVELILVNCEKQRMEMSKIEGVMMIRAAQGHTLKNVESDALLTKITNSFKFNEVVHGTYFDPLPLI